MTPEYEVCWHGGLWRTGDQSVVATPEAASFSRCEGARLMERAILDALGDGYLTSGQIDARISWAHDFRTEIKEPLWRLTRTGVLKKQLMYLRSEGRARHVWCRADVVVDVYAQLPTHKRCKDCGEEKPLQMFSKNSSGMQVKNQCKACFNAYVKAYKLRKKVA